MFTHRDIWSAIDRLAESYSLSTSGLAKEAGLDPTTFNKSKRVSPVGNNRWPSTESLSKVLRVVNMSLEDFAIFAARNTSNGPAIPVIGMAQAGRAGYFDDSGFPVGEGWDEVHVPGLKDDEVFALEISGNSMAPVLRKGSRVIVAPDEDVRRGDRVVAKTMDGEVLCKEVTRLTTKLVELKSLNPKYDDRKFERKELQWMARIVWASQ